MTYANVDHTYKAFVNRFAAIYLSTRKTFEGDQKMLEAFGFPSVQINVGECVFFQTQEMMEQFVPRFQEVKKIELFQRDVHLNKLLSEFAGCPPTSRLLTDDESPFMSELVVSYGGIIFICDKKDVGDSIAWLRDYRSFPANYGFIALWNRPAMQWIRWEGPQTLEKAKWTFEQLMAEPKGGVGV